MEGNGLLTLAAILIAAYSLMSEEKRLDIKLRMSYTHYAAIGFLIFIILVVSYSPIILSTGLIGPIKWRWGFNSEIMTFTCLLGIITLLCIKVNSRKIPASKLKKWTLASQEYLSYKKHAELSYLLNKYHEQLFKIIDTESWCNKSYNSKAEYIANNFGRRSKVPAFHNLKMKIVTISSLITSYRNNRHEMIYLSISRLMNNKDFIGQLSETHPLLCAKATQLRIKNRAEYTTYFFECLLSNPRGTFYQELRDNEQSTSLSERNAHANNQLLYFYLNDANVAKELGIWKPVGDYVVNYIKKHEHSDSFYNQPNDGYSDSTDRWDSPIFIGIQFFKTMVFIAIYQRINDHMWLMYVKSFIKEIANALSYSHDIDKDREFPTKFEYLIYECFLTCDSWVESLKHLPRKEILSKSRNNYPEYWSAKCLGEILYLILNTDNIGERQKLMFLEHTILRMNDLDNCELGNYSELIFDHAIRPYEYASINHDTVEIMTTLYDNVDYMAKIEDSTFSTKLASI